jgi:hypothetical protein
VDDILAGLTQMVAARGVASISVLIGDTRGRLAGRS